MANIMIIVILVIGLAMLPNSYFKLDLLYDVKIYDLNGKVQFVRSYDLRNE